MSLTMKKQEREAFLAEVHVGVISISEPGRGPLTVPVWYSYEPGGDLRVVTGRTSRKGRLMAQSDRLSLCVQTETAPYKYVSVEDPIVGIEDAHVAARPPPPRAPVSGVHTWTMSTSRGHDQSTPTTYSFACAR